jgi:hypothetical protein
MQSMDQMLKQFVMERQITKEAALEKANNKFLFAEGQEEAGFTPSAGAGGGPGAGNVRHAQSAAYAAMQGRSAPAPAAIASAQSASATGNQSGVTDDWMQMYGKKK